MVGINTLHQCHSLRQNGDITFDNAVDHLSSREFTTENALALQVGIDDGRLLDATIDLQACIFRTILGMIHKRLEFRV